MFITLCIVGLVCVTVVILALIAASVYVAARVPRKEEEL
jgi:hypothetical protein